MPSDRRIPRTLCKHSSKERRALIACTSCRRLKKKCKQEYGASSPRGRCQRCRATGKVCQYLNVTDDISSHVPSPPPTDLCVHMEELESANNGFPVPVALQWRYANFIETSDTGSQQPVHQSSSSSGSSTHETEDASNSSHDNHPGGIHYSSNWVDPVVDPSSSPSYASRSATESPQYDRRSSIPAYPSHSTFPVPDVDAQRPDSMNYYEHHDITNPILPLSTQYEAQYQSNIPAGMASSYYAPYDIPNQEANISDPRSLNGTWNTYHASSDSQVPSARNYHAQCLVCFAINCEIHPGCIC